MNDGQTISDLFFIRAVVTRTLLKSAAMMTSAEGCPPRYGGFLEAHLDSRKERRDRYFSFQSVSLRFAKILDDRVKIRENHTSRRLKSPRTVFNGVLRPRPSNAPPRTTQWRTAATKSHDDGRLRRGPKPAAALPELETWEPGVGSREPRRVVGGVGRRKVM